MIRHYTVRPSLLFACCALGSACSSEPSRTGDVSPVAPGATTGDPSTGSASSSTTTSSNSSSSTGTGAASTTTGAGSASSSATSVGSSTNNASSSNASTSGVLETNETSADSSQTSEALTSETSSEGQASGETSSQGATSSEESSDSGSAASPLPPTDDYSAPGPFETTSQADTGPDGTYTIVRPTTLGADGFLHAPITFGPGTGMQVSQMMGLLERIASHGFVIIGRQLEGGPRDPVTRMRMIDGLDWIIEQNSTPGSVFEGTLDVNRAVAMGYSVGGTGAVEIGGHEAIATVVSIHGHEAEGELRGPLLLMGGTEDVMSNGQSWLAPTYENSQTQTFFSLVVGADHGYIQGTHDGVPGGVETPAMIAWLRYWIYNDQAAQRYFEGDDCVMCDEPWSNPQWKNWP